MFREVNFGWCFRFIHTNGASFLFLLIYLHLSRTLYYGSYFIVSNLWFSGIFLFIFFMAIAFMGYVLPWGQMSFWGATVITNLFSMIPSFVPWVCGGFYISNSALSRFFIFHFLLSFISLLIIFVHLLLLHQISSSNPLGWNINNKISFLYFVCWKDLFFFLFLCIIGFLELYFGFISLSHPDNAFEVNILVTPLHIVPEWYLLEFYAFLKGIPNKNSGFMIMLSCILCLFIYGESRVFNVLIFSSVYTVYSYIISILFMMGYYI